jgi:hypothetical protein
MKTTTQSSTLKTFEEALNIDPKETQMKLSPLE